jgi:hypothetical protein
LFFRKIDRPDPAALPGVFLSVWFTSGFWQAVRTGLRAGWWSVKRWFYLGGDESRTAQHEAFWIMVTAVFFGFGGLLRFANHGEADHIAGWAFIGAASWIGLAFFFPLWLPRVRDAELIRERREAERRQQEQLLRLINNAVDEARRKGAQR